MTQWYYSDYERNRLGPVTARDLAQLHHAGQLQPDTLVWREGLPQWRPWREMMGNALEDAAGRTAPATTAAPLSTGVNPYAMAEPRAPAAGTLTSGTDAYATAHAHSPYAPPRAALEDGSDFVAGGEVVYAGFWKRYAALMIDSFVIGVAYYAVVIVLMVVMGVGMVGLGGGNMEQMGAGFAMAMVLVYLLYPVISGLYYIGFESSSRQATLGKMAVGIKVTDNGGQRLARGNATGRWASHLLCYFTIYIGYIIAAFTDRKRGLHDMVASTLVVDRWAYTAHPERQRRELGAVAIVVIVLSVLAILAYVAIVAAIALPAYQAYVQRVGGG